MSGSSDLGKIIPWENPELQRRIGAIPFPSLVIVEGANDTGKSVLVQQATYGALKANFKVRYITTESTIISFLNQMQSLSLNITQEFLVGKLKITPLHTDNFQWSPKTSKFLLKILSNHIELNKESDVFVVDSLTHLIAYAEEKDILSFFSFIRNFVDKSKKTVIFTIHPYALNQDLITRVRSICDGHLILEIKNFGERIVRTVTASKLKGGEGGTPNFATFEVEPAIGIKVIPFAQIKV
ncbi:MAG: ATPase domain-containing protein [Nitrososphaerota archaeon]|nr:hypothetical protein [Nitrososphaerales archaeon]MCX8192166.1 hypothetical protein [Nitrososphaerales archaeon]MDW8044273.1 ATPase domain-containing protein [Nitrososphaerota archaeon]